MLLIVSLLVAGCLPSGCQRSQPEALFPADSASRRVAARAPVDTLRLLWETDGSEEHPLEHPRTVQFGPDDQLYASDLERGSILTFDTSGVFRREIQHDAFAYPYLIGGREDTLVIYNPSVHRVDFVTNDSVARSVSVPSDDLPDGALTYAAAADDALYFKAVGEDVSGYIARLSPEGHVRERWRLPEPYWRHAGLLRTWGDSLLSLSGYRPVVDVLHSGRQRDTMAFRGFDSPMLARSRAFAQGDVDQPPLLSASAAPAGDHLFVLNMRPAQMRVDMYDRSGQLQQVLITPSGEATASVFPMDLAVRRTPGGGYALAVAAARPEPRLALYRWEGASTSGSANSSSALP